MFCLRFTLKTSLGGDNYSVLYTVHATDQRSIYFFVCCEAQQTFQMEINRYPVFIVHVYEGIDWFGRL